MRPLEGRITVVAGATRGAGRGVARALGEAGATVYCTGRSVPGNPSPYGRVETIEETAALVDDAAAPASPCAAITPRRPKARRSSDASDRRLTGRAFPSAAFPARVHPRRQFHSSWRPNRAE